ncbi:MAG: ECF transporter S component [Lachnospiraceae bacterium]
MKNQNQQVLKIALTALFAAVCYVAFTFLKIPLPGGTALHVGNAFCVLCALLIGGIYGGIAGSLGMTIADVLDPVYITSAPKTFILKLCIGLITGLVAHKIAHITESNDQRYVFKWTVISSAAGLAFNVIFDPLVGYFYKRYLLGVDADAASILTKWSSAATFINAIASIIIVTVLYMALRPALKKAGFFMSCDK